jgi:hypothetical protein
MSSYDDQQRGATSVGGTGDGLGTHGRTTDDRRPTIPRPADEQVVLRAGEDQDVVGARRKGFDLPATLAGALAALGALLLLSSLLGAAVGAIGFQTGVGDRDLSVGGLVAGLVSLFLACLVGGWVAGRIARRKGGLHGLVSAAWLVLLAAVLAGLAAVAGDRFDVTERVGLPRWFDADAVAPVAIGTGLLALALMLLGGWLGGRLGARHAAEPSVEVVQTRRHVSEHPGGIEAGGTR